MSVATLLGGPDHPRSRGVYTGDWRGRLADAGSSPLARGLLISGARWGSGPWIIPARAGFTQPAVAELKSWGDHPRSRGVYVGVHDSSSRFRGSSPLARGLQLTSAMSCAPCRIIPARAGFTHAPKGYPQSGEDHPRSRGVYRPYSVYSGAEWGSSPLARGLPYADRRTAGTLGIIPARAGFTRICAGKCRAWMDHPRSRGVY